MNNDRGLFEWQHHDPDWCGHRNYGSGTRALAGLATPGAFSLSGDCG